MIKKKFVVAGNPEEYYAFLDKHKDDINVVYLYVDSAKDLKGLMNIEGYYTGTYYKRHDIGAIKDIIKTSKNTNGYIVEPVKTLDNNHVVAYKYKQIETTLDSAYERNANDYQQLSDNSMIDSMRDRD